MQIILDLVNIAKDGKINERTTLFGREPRPDDNAIKHLSDEQFETIKIATEDAMKQVESGYSTTRDPWPVKVEPLEEKPTLEERKEAYGKLCDIYLPYAMFIAKITSQKLANWNAGKNKKIAERDPATATTQELKTDAELAVGKGLSMNIKDIFYYAVSEAEFGIGIGIDRFYANSPTYKNNVTKSINYAVRQTIEDNLLNFFGNYNAKFDSLNRTVSDGEGNATELGDILDTEEADTNFALDIELDDYVRDLIDKLQTNRIRLRKDEKEAMLAWLSEYQKSGVELTDSELTAAIGRKPGAKERVGMAKNNARWKIKYFKEFGKNVEDEDRLKLYIKNEKEKAKKQEEHDKKLIKKGSEEYNRLYVPKKEEDEETED